MSILESPLIDWTIFSSTIQLIVKGLLIGIIVSAPMGPVGVLCIQRTMHMSFVEQEQNIYWMKIGGSAILFGFGLHTLLSNPLKAIRRSKHKRGSLVHNFITSFFLTLSNPLIIFLFIALFAQLTFTVPQNPFGAFWGYMSIFGGAMLWWGGLTYLITRMKNSFGYRGMIVLNRTIGVIVLTVSVIYAFLTLFHIQVRIPISS